MNTDRNWGGIAAIVILLGIIGFGTARPMKAAQTTQNVVVTNTSSQPVPVALSNPHVYASQYGTYSVGITNPISSLDPDRNAFQRFVSFKIADGSSEMYYDTYPVYSGKRFVIEHISARSDSDTAGEAVNLVQVSAMNSGNQVAATFLSLLEAPNETTTSVGNSTAGLVAYSGQVVRVTAHRHSTIGNTYVSVLVSGHLVDNT